MRQPLHCNPRMMTRFIATCTVLYALMTTAIIAGISDPCMSVKIPLAERIQGAQAVIYGTVVSQRATWDDARRSI